MTREEMIKRIKFCGESIVNNAEKIAAKYDFTTDLSITCYPFNTSSAPEINVSTSFIPEGFVDDCNK